jgi:hypothetical protein
VRARVRRNKYGINAQFGAFGRHCCGAVEHRHGVVEREHAFRLVRAARRLVAESDNVLVGGLEQFAMHSTHAADAKQTEFAHKCHVILTAHR